MKAKITYCYNYWQIYKNPCEIVAHKKRLRSKVAVPKKTSLKVDEFSRKEQFFLWYSVYRALAAMNCVYTMYLAGI